MLKILSRLFILICFTLNVGFVASSSARQFENVQRIDNGLLIKLGQLQVELAAINPETLRLSVACNHLPKPAASSFLAPNAATNVSWSLITKEGLVGIDIQSGKLLIDPNTGEWTLEDAYGKVLIPKHALTETNWPDSATDSQIRLAVGWANNKPIGVYGCGNCSDRLLQTKAQTGLGNGKAVIPYYWSNSGYAVLAVTANDNDPAYWSATNHSVIWTFPGPTAELYLMPAASLKDAATAYANLTGHAPVPPLWTFGYLQSRWGWKDRDYIEDTLKHFQDLKLPVDAFIYDFEWFTTMPDYSVPPEGLAGYNDFGWNTNLFSEPAKQIADYKNQGVRFVGIRKPRMGNSNTLTMIHSKGWGLGGSITEQYHARDLNFSNPAMRDWYTGQLAGLLQSGVDGWWNDEGEGSFTTYYYWNLAEAEADARYCPGQRLWTLNRAFSPGLQRLGAAAWTGDIRTSWQVLAQTPASLLNWSLSGMPYGACDIGGFHKGIATPELLTRWMEAGVFFPIMRSHSIRTDLPRFPWLYGTNALDAIRDALDLRYRLIPYYYSLAHETFETGVPLMRPMIMEFPNDPKVANMSDEWMMGDSLLAAPILQTNDSRSVYLPAGDWYDFGQNPVIKGGQTIKVKAGLDEIPVYIRAGSILPLGPIIEHTSQLPGGALELQIYPGKDAAFTLVEDDGETTGYQKGKIRRTTFQWNDATGILTWKRDGDYSGKDCFQTFRAVLFGPASKIEMRSTLSAAGRLAFRNELQTASKN